MGGIRSTVKKQAVAVAEQVAAAAIEEGKKKLEETIEDKWDIPVDLTTDDEDAV